MVPAHEPAQTESLAVTKNTIPKQLILPAPVTCDSLSNTKSPFQRPPYLGKPARGKNFEPQRSGSLTRVGKPEEPPLERDGGSPSSHAGRSLPPPRSETKNGEGED